MRGNCLNFHSNLVVAQVRTDSKCSYLIVIWVPLGDLPQARPILISEWDAVVLNHILMYLDARSTN